MMKKFLIILLFPALYFSQFQAGRYMIKQAITNFSIKSLDYPAGSTTIAPTCEDYKVNCGNQIFDIKNIKESYTINVAGKNLYLTFEGTSVNFMKFKAKQATKQLFNIVANENGSFYIKPKLENNANYFVGTEMNLYPEFGSELQFLIKEKGHLPREYNDFKNVSWTFFSIPTAGNMVLPNQDLKMIMPRKTIISK